MRINVKLIKEVLGGGSPSKLEKALPFEELPQGLNFWTREVSRTELSPEARTYLTELLANRPKKGFAAMSPERHREIARLGGKAVPAEKRSFAQDHDLASKAGQRGGQSVAKEKRSFFNDHDLAARAGAKGGHKSGGQKSPRKGSNV